MDPENNFLGNIIRETLKHAECMYNSVQLFYEYMAEGGLKVC